MEYTSKGIWEDGKKCNVIMDELNESNTQTNSAIERIQISSQKTIKIREQTKVCNNEKGKIVQLIQTLQQFSDGSVCSTEKTFLYSEDGTTLMVSIKVDKKDKSGAVIVIDVIMLLLEILILTPFNMKLLGRKLFWSFKNVQGHKENKMWGGMAVFSGKHSILSFIAY